MGSQHPHSTRPRTKTAAGTKARNRSNLNRRKGRRYRTVDSQVANELVALAANLRFIFGSALAVELALRKQNADQDVDLADSLRFGVVNPAAAQMERAESLITRLGGHLPRILP